RTHVRMHRGGHRMRRYADPVEVRRGPLGDHGATEGPQQFLWRGRLWKVRAVLAHWVETGPWWQLTSARAVIGSEDEPAQPAAQPATQPAGTTAGQDPTTRDAAPRPFLGDLLTEREMWR